MSVAVLAVEVFGAGSFDFGDGSVEIGDVFFEEGSDRLANQSGGHICEARLVLRLLLWSASFAVELLQSCPVDGSVADVCLAVVRGGRGGWVLWEGLEGLILSGKGSAIRARGGVIAQRGTAWYGGGIQRSGNGNGSGSGSASSNGGIHRIW